MRKIKVLLADGNSLFLDALKLLLEKERDFDVVSNTGSGVGAVREAIKLNPDILVAGQVLPDISMLQVVRELRRSLRNMRFVFIIKDELTELRVFLGELDSFGAIRDDSTVAELIKALRAVARGERYISRDVISGLRSLSVPEEKKDDPLDAVTQREREVLYWLAQGFSNEEISEKMFLAEKTIKNHVSHVLKKLKLPDRTKAAVMAWKEGLPLIPEEFFTPPDMN